MAHWAATAWLPNLFLPRATNPTPHLYLQNETANPIVKKYLKRGNGDCIRVLGGATQQQQAILIHDAPHVGFVIGCIGPRPWNDRRAYTNVANNPSDTSVKEIMTELAKAHGKGTLYVLRS